jgi:hypothetical protein
MDLGEVVKSDQSDSAVTTPAPPIDHAKSLNCERSHPSCPDPSGRRGNIQFPFFSMLLIHIILIYNEFFNFVH